MHIKLDFHKPKTKGPKHKTPNIMIFKPKSIKIRSLSTATTSNKLSLNIYTKTIKINKNSYKQKN